MKFSKIIGTVDPKLVQQAEEKLSSIFIELGTNYTNTHIGTTLGGDPLLFSLVFPVEHVCTMNMPTAATDGVRFYWNPKFVLKKSKIGLRIIVSHESFHALYLHCQRRGSRIPKLWNIAVDYIVNNMAMDDLKTRRQNPEECFTKHMGRYMPLDKYMEMLKDPFKKIKGFEDLNVGKGETSDVKLPSPNEDRDLTEREQKELERREKQSSFYFADPSLDEDIKRPEKIYDMLYALLPKCPKCGSVGVYKRPKKDKGKGKDKDKDKGEGEGDKEEDKDKGDKGEGDGKGDQDQDGCGDCDGEGDCGCGCPECGANGDGVDIFGYGATMDEHMDTAETEEKLAKRISDAMESAKRMAGKIPAALEDELGQLLAPKISWQDIIRTRLLKARAGNGRNDWTRFRSRPMFSGLLVPKKRNYFSTFGCLLDTSGSMSSQDMTYGVSQLASLDEKAEGSITCADAEIYWENTTKIKKANVEELSKVKIQGRGGTLFADYFTDYEKNIGKCDFLIVITDGFLLNEDVANMKDPGVDVYWLITSESDFRAPFGRVLSLHNG